MEASIDLFTKQGAGADSGLLNYAAEYAAQERALRRAIGPIAATGPVVLLYDVEGTTTPLPFVTEVLFPYASAHMPAFLRQHVTDEQLKAATNGAADATATTDAAVITRAVQGAIRADAATATAAAAGDLGAFHGVLASHLEGLMRKNNKAPYLKALQGLLWRHGYESGQLLGHLFSDVAPTLRELGTPGGGRRLQQHIYSSGSVKAQQLLFRHSSAGDLTSCLNGYHDTVTAGPKSEPESYRKIAQRIGVAPERVVFLTDSLVEFEAAQAAGMLPVFSSRPCNAAVQRLAAQKAAVADRPSLALVSFSQLASAVSGLLRPLTTLAAQQHDVVRYTRRTIASTTQLKSFL